MDLTLPPSLRGDKSHTERGGKSHPFLLFGRGTREIFRSTIECSCTRNERRWCEVRIRRILCLFISVMALLLCLGGELLGAQVPKNDVSRAEFFLKKFEERVERSRGQAFRLGYEDQEALNRIKVLKEKYPDDPAVEDLFQRGRTALMKSKGDFMEITPQMLVFRENEKKLKALFGEIADKEWGRFTEEILAGPTVLPKAFPAPDRSAVSIEDIRGNYVILEDFEYPANQFIDLGREFVSVGSGTQGYYFVEISGRNWLGPYEAVKRYRRLINRDLPEDGKWTLLGRISGIEMVIPQAEKVKTVAPRWGWVVAPVAIYIPGTTFAFYDPTLEAGGVFAGEERMEEIKEPLYSVRFVPRDAAPERLVEIFAASIKEKNFDLFMDCIDPDRKKTRTAQSLIRYHWDLHLERFATLYVHVTVDEARIEVIRGFASGTGVEDFFLDEKQKEKVREISGQVVEQALVASRAWDERGRQYGSPKPHFLVRKDKGRWYINNYEQPF